MESVQAGLEEVNNVNGAEDPNETVRFLVFYLDSHHEVINSIGRGAIYADSDQTPRDHDFTW